MASNTAASLFELVALFNQGPDTACSYELRELPYSSNVLESLATEFGPGEHWKTKIPYSSEDWHLRIEPRGNNIQLALAEVLKSWVFTMPYSPKLAPAQDWVPNEIIGKLCEVLTETIGACEIFEVFVSPPVWYEASWQDFAFKGQNRTWFLHLGVTD